MSRPLFLVLAVVSACSLAGEAAEIDLHLQADTASRKVETTTLDDPRLGQPTPVLDEARAALGWHFADFKGEITGYVPDAKIGKDLLPVDNALIFSGPGTESTVLGTFRTGDPVEIIDTGEWWKIRYGGGFPVYFVLETPPPLPPVTGMAEETVVADTEEAGMFEETGAVDIPEESPPPAELLPEEQRRGPPPGTVGQRYEGVFKRSKPFLGLIQPKAPFYLEGANGRRIAWVDTSGIVIPGSIKDFLDRNVIIHGERTLKESGGDWIIQARNMRLK
ncbi:MAG: SH3 domain-containing protein [Oceanipulchritudo sp.]